jgi:hypothetical protein
MRQIKETLNLECRLTDQEKLDYGRENAVLQIMIDQKRLALKEIRDRYNAEISASESRILVLSRALDSGKEYRPIECRIERDWNRGRKLWFRNDTGEIAKDDIIPEDELQEHIGNE